MYFHRTVDLYRPIGEHSPTKALPFVLVNAFLVCNMYVDFLDGERFVLFCFFVSGLVWNIENFLYAKEFFKLSVLL